VRAVALDVAAAQSFAAAGLPDGTADRVMMNPPFHDPARHNVSPDPRRRLAHAAGPSLADWVGTAARLLGSHGVLTLIWRADGTADVLSSLAPAFGAITLLPVHPRPGAAAIRVLLRARKGSRGPLAILPGFVLGDAAGRPSPEAEAVLRHGATLPLASA
jgi:tRNA1(Val) A37 N6-methylase TrmN6